MNESTLFAKVFTKLRDFKIFRNHRGKAWQGKSYYNKNDRTVLISNPKMYEFGLIAGASDLIGWKKVKITSEMVGETMAQFVAIEGKTGRDKLSKDQYNFLKNVKESGGISLVAYGKDGEVELLGEFEDLKVKERKK